MSEHPTALAKLLDPLLTLAHHHGLEPQQLLASEQLNQEDLQKPGARFAAHSYEPLLERLSDHTGNPLIALRLGEVTQPRMLGSTGFLMSTAETLQGAYQVLIDYLPLLYEGAVLELEQTLEGSWLTLALNDEARKPTEYFLACLVNWPRWLTGHQIPAQRLEVTFPAPDNPQAWQRFFAAEIEFDAPRNRVLLASDYLSLACVDSNAEMHQLHREFADSLLSTSVQQSALIAQTRNLIRQQLSEGDGCIRREQVAAAVNLSLRTLQRKLGQLGTSFQEIYDQSRREHCLQLIQRGQYSFGEIAYRLGFANLSAFQKAFKRWMGMAPSQYRTQLRPASLQAPDNSRSEQAVSHWYDQPDAEQQLRPLLNQLSDFSLNLLQWAALCPEPFDLNLISAASNNPLARLAIHLWPAQQQALITPTSTEQQSQNPVSFRFTHPVIAPTLLNQQTTRQQQERHLKLSRAAQRQDDSSGQLYHLNQLQKLPADLARTRNRLNRQAADLYIEQGQFTDAADHLQQLLRWQESHLKPATALERARLLLLSGQPKSCQQQLAGLSHLELSPQQDAAVAQLQAQLWQQQGRHPQALTLLCHALSLLDSTLPETDSDALNTLLQQLHQIEALLESGQLNRLSPLADAEIEHRLELCEQISLLAQQQSQPLLAACAITRMASLTLNHGYNHLTPFTFISYAWVVSWFCDDQPLARFLSAEGMMHAQRYQHSQQPVAATSYLLLGSHVSHWFSSLEESREQLQQAMELGAQHRPILHAARLIDSQLAWLCGTPLHELAEHLPEQADIKASTGLLIDQLTGNSREPLPLNYDGWQAVAVSSCALLLDQQHSWPALFEQEAALEQSLAGSYGITELLFNTAMMRLILGHQLGHLNSRRRREVAATESRLEHWANQNPENFRTRWALLKAELAWLDGQPPATLFEQALAFAEQQSGLHLCALCHERYAAWLESQQQPGLARLCRAQAIDYYRQWGATAKVKLLAAGTEGLAQ